jgi:hypothetical protein
MFFSQYRAMTVAKQRITQLLGAMQAGKPGTADELD